MPFPSKTKASAILGAAVEIVEDAGWDALSMRSLARKLGVQASSLYHHFPDREAIEAALGEQAASQLLSRLRATTTLVQMAHAYLEFARENPALYHLVAGVRSSADHQPEAKKIWELLLERLAPLTGNPDDTGAAVSLWSFLHGYAALAAAGKFGPSGDGGGFDRGLNSLLFGLSAKEHIL